MAKHPSPKRCPVQSLDQRLPYVLCQEDACQWWWRCREPQTKDVPVIDDGTIEEYVDLEAMARKLVYEIMASWDLNRVHCSRAYMINLALATLQEAQRWGERQAEDRMRACFPFLREEARDGG